MDMISLARKRRTPRALAGQAGAAAFALALLLAPDVHGQAAGQAAAQAPFELITAAEQRAEARAEAAAPPSAPRTRTLPRPDATAIRIVAPVPSTAPVRAPLRIELAFRAAPGTCIVPGSFRIFYGVLKIDLTERLKQHASVDEQGVVVEGAQMPDGQHRLLVQVADDRGGTAEQDLVIRVGRPS